MTAAQISKLFGRVLLRPGKDTPEDPNYDSSMDRLIKDFLEQPDAFSVCDPDDHLSTFNWFHG